MSLLSLSETKSLSDSCLVIAGIKENFHLGFSSRPYCKRTLTFLGCMLLLFFGFFLVFFSIFRVGITVMSLRKQKKILKVVQINDATEYTHCFRHYNSERSVWVIPKWAFYIHLPLTPREVWWCRWWFADWRSAPGFSWFYQQNMWWWIPASDVYPSAYPCVPRHNSETCPHKYTQKVHTHQFTRVPHIIGLKHTQTNMPKECVPVSLPLCPTS